MLSALSVRRGTAAVAALAAAAGGIAYAATNSAPLSLTSVAKTTVSPLPHACPQGCDIWDLGGRDDSGPKRVWNMPTQVKGLSGVTDALADDGTHFALRTDGTVWAWGRNTDGALGNGTTKDSTAPAPIKGLKNITQISVSYGSVAALDKSGSVWAWGRNVDAWNWGSTGTDTPRTRPTKISGLTNVARIFPWTATTRDGKGYLWANGKVAPLTALKPIVHAEPGTSGYAVTMDGAAVGNTKPLDPTPHWAALPGTGVLRTSETGGTNANISTQVGLRTDGSVAVWGKAWGVKQGMIRYPAPETMKGLPAKCSAVAAGDINGYALCGGTVFGWGAGNRLGAGSHKDTGTAVQAKNLTGVSAIAASNASAYALTKGTLWAWGLEPLGLPLRTASYSIPTKVTGISGKIQGLSIDSGSTLVLVRR